MQQGLPLFQDALAGVAAPELDGAPLAAGGEHHRCAAPGDSLERRAVQSLKRIWGQNGGACMPHMFKSSNMYNSEHQRLACSPSPG